MRIFAFAVMTLLSLPTIAQDEVTPDTDEGSYEPRLSLSGFGEFGLSGRNHTGDRFATGSGAEADNSVAFTIPAIGLRLDYKVNRFIGFASEAEYVSNHGVRLNKLTVGYSFCPELVFSGGIMRLPIGHANTDYGFTDFLTNGRPEGECAIMPAPLSECGVSLSGRLPFGLDYQATVSTGANPDAFTTQDFVKDSQQGFGNEEEKFGSPAFTCRLGYSGVKGLRIGAGIYYCPNTARNMTEYKDFKTFYTPERDVPLTIYYADARYAHDWFTLCGSFLEGNMGNSFFLTNYFFDRLDDANADGMRYNGGNIAKIARTYMGEIGVNIKNILYPYTDGPDIIPFAHYEYYNSQEQGQASSVRMDPRGKVRKMTFGINWRPTDGVMFKCNYTTRRIGEYDDFHTMNEVNVGLAYDLSFLEL